MEMNRTMVTIGKSGTCITFRTVDKLGVRSPSTFYITSESFHKLDSERYMLVRDAGSFAEMWVDPDRTELQINVTWLSDHGADQVSGRRETVRLDWGKVLGFATNPYTQKMQLLSNVEVQSNPRLIISSRKNIKEVLANKTIRHKFAKCVAKNFHYWTAREIRLYDDFSPYSFYFREIRKDGRDGLCGGVILHNADDVRTARYSIHT